MANTIYTSRIRNTIARLLVSLRLQLRGISKNQHKWDRRIWSVHVLIRTRRRSRVLDKIMRMFVGISRSRRRDIHSFWAHGGESGIRDALHDWRGDWNRYNIVTGVTTHGATSPRKDKVVALEIRFENFFVEFLLPREEVGHERPLFLFRSRGQRSVEWTRILDCKNRGACPCNFHYGSFGDRAWVWAWVWNIPTLERTALW